MLPQRHWWYTNDISRTERQATRHNFNLQLLSQQSRLRRLGGWRIVKSKAVIISVSEWFCDGWPAGHRYGDGDGRELRARNGILQLRVFCWTGVRLRKRKRGMHCFERPIIFMYVPCCEIPGGQQQTITIILWMVVSTDIYKLLILVYTADMIRLKVDYYTTVVVEPVWRFRFSRDGCLLLFYCYGIPARGVVSAWPPCWGSLLLADGVFVAWVESKELLWKVCRLFQRQLQSDYILL